MACSEKMFGFDLPLLFDKWVTICITSASFVETHLGASCKFTAMQQKYLHIRSIFSIVTNRNEKVFEFKLNIRYSVCSQTRCSMRLPSNSNVCLFFLCSYRRPIIEV